MNGAFDASQFTKGKFFKADEITAPVVLTVNQAYVEKFEDGSSKPVLSFLEADQDLVLNRTRTESMIMLFGTNSAAWHGQRVTLYPAQFRGQRMIGIQPAPPLQGPTVNGQAVPVQPAPQAPTPAMAVPQQAAPVQTNANGEIVFQNGGQS